MIYVWQFSYSCTILMFYTLINIELPNAWPESNFLKTVKICIRVNHKSSFTFPYFKKKLFIIAKRISKLSHEFLSGQMDFQYYNLYKGCSLKKLFAWWIKCLAAFPRSFCPERIHCSYLGYAYRYASSIKIIFNLKPH